VEKKHLILVAGGSGSRMGSATPKQFLLLGGRPILLRTLEQFFAYDSTINVVIALPEAAIEAWQKIVKTYAISIPHTFVVGGATRFHSVKNALSKIEGEGLVAVHDGVRPLVSHATIEFCFGEAEKSGAAIPTIPLSDSIRKKVGDGKSVAVNRSDFCAVQTPQVFRLSVLRKAYEQEYCNDFTDDASVVESAGYKVSLVQGNVENIKVTTPADLIFAEAIIKKVTGNE
jgi:2-C-methyl-D-erythritol 4-phosphate cytidylyltransferase